MMLTNGLGISELGKGYNIFRRRDWHLRCE